MEKNETKSSWTFLTNHSHVLLCLAKNPDIRMRDIAAKVGITERAVQRIIADLHNEGYLSLHREGRRNHYEVHVDRNLKHPMEAEKSLADLIRLIFE